MPSDDGYKSPDSSDSSKPDSTLVKAVAAVFATVVAPVLVAVGIKFGDVIVAPFQPTPPEVAAKSDPEKPAVPAAPAASPAIEPVKSEPAKSDIAKVEPVAIVAKDPAPDTGRQTNADNKEPATPRKKKKQANDSPGSSGYKSIFNGRDLTGWQVMDERLWSVDRKTQALVGKDPDNGSKNQNRWIYSEQNFADVQLMFEFRLGSSTDAGFALRTQPGGSRADSDRFEIQLTNDSGNAYKTGTIFGLRAGPGHPHTRALADVDFRPASDWNTAEIEFRGARLRLSINGKLVQDARFEDSSDDKKSKKAFSSSGRVGLQIHTGRIEFRKIELLELNQSAGK